MIIPIAAAIFIFQRAKKHGLLAWPWLIFTFLGYFVAQFLTGVLLALFNPDLLYENDLQLTIISIASSIAGLVIVWLTLEYVAYKKKNKTDTVKDANILDNDQYLEKL